MTDTATASDGDRAGVVRVSFALTRAQRVLDPPERLMVTVCALGIVLGVAAILILRADFSREWFAACAVYAAAALLVLTLWHRPMLSFYRALTNSEYINVVEISRGSVRFGVGEPQLQLSRKMLKVSRGMCGTFVVRDPRGYVLVLPKDVMPFAQLKELIEG